VFVRQRESRLLFRMSLEYIWVRAILIAEDSIEQGGFRWVDGEYSNKKDISFQANLEPGNYYLLVYPEWVRQHKYQHEIYITVYSNEDVA
jgi:hypothetical protein